MIVGLSGPLLSHDAIEEMSRTRALPELTGEAPPDAVRGLRACHAEIRNRLGPSCGARTLFDRVAEPLAGILGFRVVPLPSRSDTIDAILQTNNVAAAVMIVTPWGQPTGAIWRHAVHRGLSQGTRWCLCFSGPVIRVIDAERTYARRYADLNLEAALDNPRSLAILWSLLRAGSMGLGHGLPALDLVVSYSETHRAQVRQSLRRGVHDALLQLVSAFRRVASDRHPGARIFDESLIVIYRILFLLFAEARGLVPAWHPVYRDGYTIEALRPRHDRSAPTGVWEALQAIARLAHRGCRAGTLRVPPFNGRLFSPSDAPLSDTVPLDDRVVSQAVVALTTRKGAGGLEHISYGDLGVEQLGGVYEHLLDYDVAAPARGSPAVLVRTGRRKATGSFYTPRSLTEFLVRRTLAPIVDEAPPERILGLRVLDPAMGSGAFLVAACRYLAAAYEQALVREGGLAPGDIEDADRAGFRRAVAQRCLFGVDINSTAVQLARLSVWLATLAADRPLTFLDHHLRTGNSLVGSSVDDLMRHTAPGSARRRARDLPLFQLDHLHSSVESVVASRTSIADTPDDTLEQVREKERTLALLNRPGGPLERWKTAADVWCAAWYPEGRHGAGRAIFQSLLDGLVRGSSPLPSRVSEALLARAREAAAQHGFFHWSLEFPEVFSDRLGRPKPDAGFDVIIGNPPWEMLRNEGNSAGVGELQAFTRQSGIYRLQGHGHGNLYQMFLERILRLLRHGGRAGLILPAGVASDQAAGPLRRFLLDRTQIDTFTVVDNRDAIFPIHRGLKFLLLTLTREGTTTELPVRTGIHRAEDLDVVPDAGVDRDAVRVPRRIIEHTDPQSLAVPEIRGALDLEILSAVTFRTPALGDADGWNVHFGRELNATDDRPHLRRDGDGMPVLEGKLLRPFKVNTAAARYIIPERVAASLLNADLTYRRGRLGYRDVASATNRMTLIAAIVPPGVVTTHTIFCLKEALDDESQQFLCGVFNSFVANYFVRMRVGMHVTATVLARVPVPKPRRPDPLFRSIARLSRALSRTSDQASTARLNALVAKLYGLTSDQFAYVLDTFPLVPERERAEALRELKRALRVRDSTSPI